VRDCDEAVSAAGSSAPPTTSWSRLGKALSRKASALLELAGCAEDYAPAVRALQQSLAEHYSEETLDRLGRAESKRKELEEKERWGQAADHNREIGLAVWVLLDHGFFE